MTTYNQIYNKPELLESEDLPTRQAWAAMKVLSGRKGFDWWFDDLTTSLKNEIFEEMRKTIAGVKP